MTHRLTIAVDVDEVLSASAEGFIAYSNDRWGTKLTLDDYTEHWAKMWQVTEQESEERLAVYNKDQVLRSYKPFAQAKDVLQELATTYRLLVATSRSMILSEDTLLWINEHFEGIFANVHHSGIYDTLAEDRHIATKAPLLKEINAHFLIDDQPKHCIGALEIGVSPLLFGDYSWNRNHDLPDGIVRCRDWAAVREFFRARS